MADQSRRVQFTRHVHEACGSLTALCTVHGLSNVNAELTHARRALAHVERVRAAIHYHNVSVHIRLAPLHTISSPPAHVHSVATDQRLLAAYYSLNLIIHLLTPSCIPLAFRPSFS